MKYLFSLILIVFTFAPIYDSAASNDVVITEISIEQSQDYKDGWEDGYCEGWKDVKGRYAYCPYTPYPPYPEYGQNTYRGGYNAGFKRGRRDAYKTQ